MDNIRQRLEVLEIGAGKAIASLEARIEALEDSKVPVQLDAPAFTPDLKKYDEEPQGYPEGQDGGK